MRRNIILAIIAFVLTGGTAAYLWCGTAKSAAQASSKRPLAEAPAVVAAPGRVEPKSEDIKLGSELNGKISQILVEEGDRVRRGQPLAVLVNDDYRAQVASAEAQVASREADLRKIENGARREERREALAAVRSAEATLENARATMDRHRELFREGVAAREESEQYERQFKVAEAQYDAAIEHHKFIDEEAREEDRSRAESDVRLARAQLDEARARYSKTILVSPVDGMILRRHHRAGEIVTNSATAPDPVFTLGDASVLRVRVDVDETDVSKIKLGDRAYVTADAYGSKKFWGRVVRIGQELGRKNVRTDEPTERVDTKILETLIELDDAHELPMGLRVDAFIVVN
jgi:ABC exporter DevB family membrane fusion protein